MSIINPYLTFDGNCEAAFNFYRSVFGGDFNFIGRFRDMPAEYEVPDADKEKIMHISLPISKETILMGSDSSESFGVKPNFGNSISISVSTTDKAEADRFFNALSEGGTVTMPMENTFWGDYFGMLVDKFGINWMVSQNDGTQQ